MEKYKKVLKKMIILKNLLMNNFLNKKNFIFIYYKYFASRYL